MSDVKHPDSNRAGRMPLNWSKTFAVAFLLALAALGPLRGIVFPAPFSRMPGAKAGGTNSAWEGRDAGRAAGGVVSLDRRVTAALWGTRIESEGADAFTGEVKLECAAPDSTKLVIPVSGRTSAPNMLRARVLDANGSVLREWMHPGHDFAIEVGRWEIEAPAGTARVELILIDTMSGAGGWLGVGKLSPATEASRDPVLRPEHNFGFFLAHAVALAGFLFMPGLAMRAWIRRLAMPVALLPLPGFALAAATGLAVWLTDPAASAIVAIVFQVAHVAFAILVLSLRAPANNADERHASA